MRTTALQNVILICTAALIVQQATRKLVIPMLRRIRKSAQTAQEVARVILGDPDHKDDDGNAAPLPSLAATLAGIRRSIAEVRAGQEATAAWTREHQEWHSGTARVNGPVGGRT